MTLFAVLTWGLGKWATQNFLCFLLLFLESWTWVGFSDWENTAFRFCAVASLSKTRCMVSLNEAFYLGSKQVCEHVFMPFLPNAEKQLFTKTEQTRLNLLMPLWIFLWSVWHHECLNTMNYTWKCWSTFELYLASENFRKCLKFLCTDTGFVRGDCSQGTAFHHFILEKSWNSK